jgi:hypothetical protein
MYHLEMRRWLESSAVGGRRVRLGDSSGPVKALIKKRTRAAYSNVNSTYA